MAGTLLTPKAQESIASAGIHEACPHCRHRVTPDGELGLLGGAGFPPACSQCVQGTPRGVPGKGRLLSGVLQGERGPLPDFSFCSITNP